MNDFWKDFVDREDKDNRLDHFFFGNDHYTKDHPNYKWGGVEGTDVGEDIYERVGDPLIKEFNENLEESLLGEIEDAGTTDDVAEIEVPDNLLSDTVERIEDAKNTRFSELRGDEIREAVEDPSTEVSQLNQLLRDTKKLTDTEVRHDLEKAIKSETRRLADLNQFFLEGVREETTDTGLNNWIDQIRDSDLRDKQKAVLLRVAEARRGSGFPELSEV